MDFGQSVAKHILTLKCEGVRSQTGLSRAMSLIGVNNNNVFMIKWNTGHGIRKDFIKNEVAESLFKADYSVIKTAAGIVVITKWDSVGVPSSGCIVKYCDLRRGIDTSLYLLRNQSQMHEEIETQRNNDDIESSACYEEMHRLYAIVSVVENIVMIL